MTRAADRRQGRRRRASRARRQPGRRLPRRHRPRARARRRCWSARTRPARSMSAPRARRRSKPGWRASRTRSPPTPREAELLALVDRLNADPAVDGILVQLPLPPHIDANTIILAIDPDKDVDGFHPVNAGRLAIGLPGFVPCTPLGCLHAAQGRAWRPRRATTRWSSAARTSSASRWRMLLLERKLHRDHRPLAAPATCRRSSARPTSSSPRSGAPEDDHRRLAQARRDRHRRRHQPHRRADGKGGWSAMSTSPSASEVAGGDHPGSRRGRPDDHRLPDPQHVRLRRPPRRISPMRRV